MVSLNVKQLLEAGVHFGHQTRHWNPKMARYIFGERNGIYIIDLEKTMHGLEKACQFLKETTEKGGLILFVGTKKQGQEVVKTAAQKCGMPYVHQRWLGGMLTNFETIRKSISRLEEIEKMETEGTYQFLTKKEVSCLQKEKEKLNKVLEGVRKMGKLPEAVFIVDPGKEDLALKESARLGIPVVALIDTNTNPDKVTYVIPGNDDAIRSITLICDIVASAVKEGREKFLAFKAAEEARLIAEAEAREKLRLEKEAEIAAQAVAKAAAEAAGESAPQPEAEEADTDDGVEVDEEIIEKFAADGTKIRTGKTKVRKGTKAKE